MTEIRFTLGDSDVWHIIQLDYKLSKQELKDEHILSAIIKNEQDKCKELKAKKVKVFDDNGKLLASSSNILEHYKLEYNNDNIIKNEND